MDLVIPQNQHTYRNTYIEHQQYLWISQGQVNYTPWLLLMWYFHSIMQCATVWTFCPCLFNVTAVCTSALNKLVVVEFEKNLISRLGCQLLCDLTLFAVAFTTNLCLFGSCGRRLNTGYKAMKISVLQCLYQTCMS